ncbi:MAG: ComF family protein [Deltaproteobacteria bacterium]|nr:ComF family protein [Deltaproteobacteria bacterium]
MNLLKQLADILYPPRCAVCSAFLWKGPLVKETGSPWFCAACIADFRSIASPVCPVCGQPFPSEVKEDHLCEDCLRKSPFYEAAWAPYRYEGAILEAIHRLKYGSKGFLADAIGPLLARFTGERFDMSGSVLIMPVPLHPRRIRERGFNQSLLLARHVARRLQLDLDFLSLRRVRYTLPQTRLAKKERQQNVRGAFQLKNLGSVRGKTILLVDDVVTTGNTLNECARILKKGGAVKVFGVSLARAAR